MDAEAVVEATVVGAAVVASVVVSTTQQSTKIYALHHYMLKLNLYRITANWYKF